MAISQKIHNYNYAPGIATYGATGDAGENGSNGNNIFFTDSNFTGDSLISLTKQIELNYVPILSSTTVLNRPYQNGDYFFTLNGVIYQLKNIDDIINKGATTGDSYSKYFNIIGLLNLQNAALFFSICSSNKRLILNADTYNGFDIINTTNITNPITYVNKDAAMNIISNVQDSNNNINLVQFTGLNNYNIVDGQLLIYFDTNDNAFHISTSGAPICLNGTIKVNSKNLSENIDDYSQVLAADDTLTVFKNICKNFTYTLDESTDGTVSLILTCAPSTADKSIVTLYLSRIKSNLFIKVYINNYNYVYQLPSAGSDGTYTLELNSYITSSDQVLLVSLLYNSEIFIAKSTD